MTKKSQHPEKKPFQPDDDIISTADIEYKKQVNESLKNTIEQFDKSITYIASGAFAISFAFIDKIVQVHEAGYNYLLIVALALFAMVVLLSLVYHYVSIQQHHDYMLKYNALSNEQRIEEWKKKTRIINRSSIIKIIGLIAGSVFLFTYILLNT